MPLARFATALLCTCAAFACRTPSSKPVSAAPSTPQAASTGAVRLTEPVPPPPVERWSGAEERAAAADEVQAALGNDAIVIAGQRFSIGAPVVLWTDPGGYSAYGTEPLFAGAPSSSSPTGLRYRPGRRRGDFDSAEPSLAELREVVDQFVLHFDVCGVSRQCMRVLHDLRGLSVHFLLDIDGTLYQTLDLRETAWHARQANARSVGIEIANIGAYAEASDDALRTWYAQDNDGWRVTIPGRLGDGGVRTHGFVGRPARAQPVEGKAQGKTLVQFDFTPQQYETLTRLTAVLCRELPRIEPDAPRDARGVVRSDALNDASFENFRGVIGHLHVTTEKVDPGPALDWERLLAGVRAQLR